MGKSRAVAAAVALIIGLIVAPALPTGFRLRAELGQFGAVPQADGGLRFTQPVSGGLRAGLTQAWRAHVASVAAQRRAAREVSLAGLEARVAMLVNPIALVILLAAYALARVVQRWGPGGSLK